MTSTPEKVKFPRELALSVVRELLPILQPACERLIVAGSLRRRKEQVGDIEILYVPRQIKIADPEDFLGRMIDANAVDVALEGMLAAGTVGRRLNVNGSPAWGETNKLAVHCASGVPIDLFTASHRNWWNLLVCRTGGAATNIAICQGAQRAGWKWSTHSPGFTRRSKARGEGWIEIKEVSSETEVFNFAGLDFKEPWERL